MLFFWPRESKHNAASAFGAECQSIVDRYIDADSIEDAIDRARVKSGVGKNVGAELIKFWVDAAARKRVAYARGKVLRHKAGATKVKRPAPRIQRHGRLEWAN